MGIPTWARGARVFDTLDRLAACDPAPAEVIVHVDNSNGEIESILAARYPSVRVLSSATRVGPGGGRHRCLEASTQPIFASFDDDSWPVDGDYFRQVVHQFEQHPRAAIVMAEVFHRNEPLPERSRATKVISDYAGCGYAIRTSAYRQTSGHVDRFCPYGIEEVDIALQLHALGWLVIRSFDLRVFHDTTLSHRAQPETNAGVVENVALWAFLRYPATLWPHALLQLANLVLFLIRSGRSAGILRGLAGIPRTLREYSGQRRPLRAAQVRAYLRDRRARWKERRALPAWAGM